MPSGPFRDVGGESSSAAARPVLDIYNTDVVATKGNRRNSSLFITDGPRTERAPSGRGRMVCALKNAKSRAHVI